MAVNVFHGNVFNDIDHQHLYEGQLVFDKHALLFSVVQYDFCPDLKGPYVNVSFVFRKKTSNLVFFHETKETLIDEYGSFDLFVEYVSSKLIKAVSRWGA